MAAAGDMYDTDMDDKMGLAGSPAKPPLQEAGLDIQATQAGVSTLLLLYCFLRACCHHQNSRQRIPRISVLLRCSQWLLVAGGRGGMSTGWQGG